MELYLGLMSGTSMDGIDVALLDVKSNRFMAGNTYPYPAETKLELLRLMTQTETTLEAVFQCHRRVGEAFASAVNQFLADAKIDRESIRAIGSHGQTIRHAPHADPAYTVQLGCAHTLAAQTGLTVVADFRTRDIVLKGEGAPLAPLYHQVLFEKFDKPLAILNLGGVANLTFLSQDRVFGYDVGPGNGLLDAWIFSKLDRTYDEGGEWARLGQILPGLLARCLVDPFFSEPAPKSLDKAYFSLDWLAGKMEHIETVHPADIQATLLQLTVEGVLTAIKQEGISLNQLLVCGGGVHNQLLMQQLALGLPSVEVKSTSAVGVHPDYIEAMMIAWLAAQTLERNPLDLGPITGGKPTILGGIYPTV